MSKSRKYDPRKCQRRIIASFRDAFGNEVSLMAHHAFSWAICKNTNGKIVMVQLPRTEARREYNRLEKAYK